MRAVYALEHGGPEILHHGELPGPEPADGQVLVRVLAAGVGPWDAWMLRGVFGQAQFPVVPGAETVGEVIALGAGVTHVSVGDRVLTYREFSGGWAERAVLDARQVAPAPRDLSPVEAAALPVSGSTAVLGLRNLAVEEGTTLLVCGAGSLVGHYIVQLAARRGARVLATAGARNHQRLRELGASTVVDYHGDWIQALRPHGPADVAFDAVGPDAVHGAFALLRDGGQLVTIIVPGLPGDLAAPRGITWSEQETPGDAELLGDVSHPRRHRRAHAADRAGLSPRTSRRGPQDGGRHSPAGQDNPEPLARGVAGATLTTEGLHDMTHNPRTALIVVDMQNLFVDAVGAENPGVLAAVNDYIAIATQRGWPIYYTRDYAPDELPEPDPQRRAELHPDLDVRGTVVTKGPGKHGGFSGFLHSPADQASGVGGLSSLAGLLREAQVHEVTVVGIATDVCVAATARDALRLGYRVSIPLDATAFVHAHPHGDQAALNDLTAAGVHLFGRDTASTQNPTDARQAAGREQ